MPGSPELGGRVFFCLGEDKRYGRWQAFMNRLWCTFVRRLHTMAGAQEYDFLRGRTLKAFRNVLSYKVKCG